MIKHKLKEIALKLPFIARLYKKRLINKSIIETYDSQVAALEEAEKVIFDGQVCTLDKVMVGLVKDAVFLGDEKFISTRSYYPKYERFLNNNNIKYEFYDIHKSNWIEEASKFDVIIWHTDSDPSTQSIAQNKIYVLDKLLNKRCLPSFDEIWSYEEKINSHYLYKVFNLPEIPTFVTHSKEEALSFIHKVKYPLISKLTTGSASFGVEKLENVSQALKLVETVFSARGRKTYFPFTRQKDYVYFQKFIDDASYDLRVITIGNKAFGYYRYPNKGDYKASGAGNYEKKEIPIEALDLAFKVKSLFGSVCIATDFLYSSKENKYYIIESSIFIGIDTCSQLEIDGTPGYYKRQEEGKYIFVKGKFWIQEITLKEFFSSL